MNLLIHLDHRWMKYLETLTRSVSILIYNSSKYVQVTYTGYYRPQPLSAQFTTYCLIVLGNKTPTSAEIMRCLHFEIDFPFTDNSCNAVIVALRNVM